MVEKIPGPSFAKGFERQSLPPGLDPITAGRWGVWLFAKRKQARALDPRRCLTNTNSEKTLGMRAAELICRWDYGFCPGKWRVLGEICGVSRWTAKAYLSGARRFTAERARKMLAFLEAEMVERVEVMRLLREAANTPEPTRKKGTAEALLRYHREKRIARIKAEKP